MTPGSFSPVLFSRPITTYPVRAPFPDIKSPFWGSIFGSRIFSLSSYNQTESVALPTVGETGIATSRIHRVHPLFAVSLGGDRLKLGFREHPRYPAFT